MNSIDKYRAALDIRVVEIDIMKAKVEILVTQAKATIDQYVASTMNAAFGPRKVTTQMTMDSECFDFPKWQQFRNEAILNGLRLCGLNAAGEELTDTVLAGVTVDEMVLTVAPCKLTAIIAGTCTGIGVYANSNSKPMVVLTVDKPYPIVQAGVMIDASNLKITWK